MELFYETIQMSDGAILWNYPDVRWSYFMKLSRCLMELFHETIQMSDGAILWNYHAVR